MNNNGFKNVLVGEKVELDISWPSLNEINAIKRPNKKNINSTSGDQFVSEKCKAHNFSSKGNDNCNSECEQLRNVDNNTYSPVESQLKVEEFPELTDALQIKKQIFVEKKNICSSSSKCLSPEHGQTVNKCSFKHPKLKKGIITLPLLSFVKAPHLKKKCLLKKTKHESTLCGNKLDKDQPVRRKGKVRLHKKKYESRLKKEIILSKTLRRKRIVYNQNILKVKCLLPSVINCCKDLDIKKLESVLSCLKITENDQECKNAENAEKTCEAKAENKLSSKEIVKSILHSQLFREYCTNVVSPVLLKSVESLINALRNFQDRSHAKEPVKALAKRRYVCGFKESKKFLLADKVKLIIIATNLQLDSDLPSGRVLDDIKSLAEKNEIPLVFAGRGNQIGYWTLKKRRISIVSILNYEGVEELFQVVMKNWDECKKTYTSVLEQIECYVSEGGFSKQEGASKVIEEHIRESIISKLFPPD